MIKFKDDLWVLIPARGGSKSIPLKNMANLNGKPLISYAITTAKNTPSVSKIVCSTDSKKIALYCKEQGISVLARPDSLSGDNIPTVDVIIHFLKHFKDKGNKLPEFIVLMEPTSPFVKVEHIEECLQLINKDKDATSVQTVTESPPNHHAYNQRIIKNNVSIFLFPNERKCSFNKQTKSKHYTHGNVRIIRISSLLESGNLFGEKSLALIIPRKFSLDADSYEDFELAEMYIKSGLIF
jgi:CMP-N,N'-diacetyllegionaminic acid synthase